MTLSSVGARVLACLIEKETTVADSYPLTMKALLSACNQTSNRHPQTNYDEHTVTQALGVLKADGFVRFVHPSHGGRTLRYRHIADERWELGRGELGVLAMLILRGPETQATLRARAERHLREGDVGIDEALATLTSGEEPFVRLLVRKPGEREARYAQLVAVDESTVEATETTPAPPPSPSPPTVSAGEQPPAASDEHTDLVEALLDEVSELRRRVERLERLIDG